MDNLFGVARTLVVVDKRTPVSLFALGFLLSLGLAQPAFAHSAITSTFPAADSTATLVDSVSVTANEDLLDLGGDGTGSVFSVTDANGHFFGDGCVTIDGPTSVMDIQLGEPGMYTVAYRVVSADGHPIEGSWAFTYAPDSETLAGEAYLTLPVCGETPTPVEPPDPEPTPAVTVAEPLVETFNLAPIIGAITIPLVIGAIWILIRLLGKSDSEDHLT